MIHVVRKAVGVQEERVLEAELLGPRVHHLDEFEMASRDLDAKRYRAVVRRIDHQGIEQFLYRENLSLLETYSAADISGRLSGYLDLLVEVKVLHDEKACHHLCKRSR